MKQELNLSALIRELVPAHVAVGRKTVRRNLVRLTSAFLRLAVSVRPGHGSLHLTSIARARPEGTTSKSNYKRLSRFLKNRHLDPASLAECMLALILGRPAPSWTLVVFDQTSVNGVEVMKAAIPLQGCAVPVAKGTSSWRLRCKADGIASAWDACRIAREWPSGTGTCSITTGSGSRWM